MYLKLYAAGDNIYKVGKIIYTGVEAQNVPSYEEAAQFLQRFFKLEKEVTIRVKDDTNPNRKRRGDAYFHNILKHIYIGKNQKYPEVIIHEIIHKLCNAKLLPPSMTRWAPRALDMTYRLIKLRQNNQDLENFSYYSPTYYSLWDHWTFRSQKVYFDLGYSYYNIYKKDAGTKYLRHIVEKFNAIQLKKFVFFTGEYYELGAFAAGIAKSILNDSLNVDTGIAAVILFFQKLAENWPLEEAINHIQGGKHYPHAYVLAHRVTDCLNNKNSPPPVRRWAPVTAEIAAQLVEAWDNDKVHDFKKGTGFDAGYDYYNIHKQGFNPNDTRYRWLIDEFNKIQTVKNYKSQRLTYSDAGMFIAGMMKGILCDKNIIKDKNNIEPVISFLRNLTALKPLGEAIQGLQ